MWKELMKRPKLLWFVGLLLAAAIVISFARRSKSPEKEKVIIDFVSNTLSFYHYDPQAINDDFSKKAFSLYLKRLDFSKLFLTKQDVDSLKLFETQIDDQINNGSTEFFDYSVSLITRRTLEAQSYYKEILASPFDFNQKENFETDAEKLNFAKNKAELKDYWRKYVKYQVLTRLAEQLEIQEKALETKDTLVKQKSLVDLEADTRQKVLKTLDDWFRRMGQLDEEDRFSIYVNSIANVYDPHTEYFPPEDKQNFDISMTGQFEGIGATLQEDDSYTKVVNLVPGSASWLQGELKVNDLILKVAQGAAEPVDVVGMPLKDVVKLIRGKKGTEVRLTVKKVDGSIKVISIVRDVVVIDASYAKSAILKRGNIKVGYIYLPQFYEDFTGTMGGRSSAIDVSKEIAKLYRDSVNGIILDLRNNGGGALTDAVDMGGLFIRKGPIVQVKAKTGQPKILDDRDERIQYNGPLAIMVNGYSASASEILAAAMQDYQRAVIIGSRSTFGKGTVQSFVDLDELLKNRNQDLKPLGSLKLTIQKFYRVNGGSTQLRGVTPDIILPDIYSELDRGEKDQDFCMSWSEIKPVSYEETHSLGDLPRLKNLSKKRVSESKYFEMISKESSDLKKKKDESTVSLNLADYRKEEKARKESDKEFDKFGNKESSLNIFALKADETTFASDSTKALKAKSWFSDLKKDFYLDEAFSVINDMQPQH
jgi:carboxyl-terminal processing protease